MKNMLLISALVSAVSFSPAFAERPDNRYNPGNSGADGYRFSAKVFERESVEVRLHTYPNSQALNDEVRRRTDKLNTSRDNDVAGFSALHGPDYKVCDVHIVDPSVSYRPEALGHEIAHCFYGQFHKDNYRTR